MTLNEEIFSVFQKQRRKNVSVSPDAVKFCLFPQKKKLSCFAIPLLVCIAVLHFFLVVSFRCFLGIEIDQNQFKSNWFRPSTNVMYFFYQQKNMQLIESNASISKVSFCSFIESNCSVSLRKQKPSQRRKIKKRLTIMDEVQSHVFWLIRCDRSNSLIF